MSPGGISSVVLGYSRFDGGAARVGVRKLSLFSDIIGGRPTVCKGELYKACSLYKCISYVLISGVCVRRELIFPYVIFVIFKCICFCLRRKALHSLGSE